MVVGSSPVAATLSSYIKPGLCKEFLDIQATSESRFTLNIFFFLGGGGSGSTKKCNHDCDYALIKTTWRSV